MQLSLQSDIGSVVRVAASGKLTQADLPADEEPLGDLLGGDYSRRVVLNMQQAELVDSSGISWLLAAHKRLRDAGGKLVLHSVQPLVLNVLRVLKLELVLCLAKNEEDAVARVVRENHGEARA